MMGLRKHFGLSIPIIGAPMAGAAGGALASAVSEAGGLGMIGGAYCDGDWIEAELRRAKELQTSPGDPKNTARANGGGAGLNVGIGFITWRLAEAPEVLGRALAHRPAAVFLSFGDIAPFEAEIHGAGIPIIAQVQTMAHGQAAVDAGADIIVAQGAEAGGHGQSRATMTLVPEMADWLAKNTPHVPLLAAGGIADGRGMAAALMLGAQGVVIGSRLWASPESLAHPNHQAAALKASGDDTLRSTVMDIARRLNWPAGYTARVLHNQFTKRWHGSEVGLRDQIDTEAPRWAQAMAEGDAERSNTFVGEVAGLLYDVRAAAELIDEIHQDAARLLAQAPHLMER